MRYTTSINILCLFTSLLTLVFLYTYSSPTYSDLRTDEYSFGVVPQYNASHILEIWSPVLRTLSKETGLNFRLIGSDSIPEFEKEFAAGRFDFVYMNPYHFVKASRSQGYTPLLRDIGKNLYGIVVVHKDSPLHTVAELDGQVIAFPAPNAVGASLIPRADFKNRYGITIKPRYVRSHSSVYLNVALGKMPAGGGVQKTLKQQPNEIRDSLRVIYKSKPFVSHPIAVHPRVPTRISDAVTRAFLTMGDSVDGKKLLSRIPVQKIGTASSDDYRSLSELGLEEFYKE